MGVGIPGQYLLANIVLNEIKAASGSGVIGIHQGLLSKGGAKGLLRTNYGFANFFDQLIHVYDASFDEQIIGHSRRNIVPICSQKMKFIVILFRYTLL